jgi:hypothetical protein
MNILRNIVLVLSVWLTLGANPAIAQDYYDIRGNWQVKQFTTRTQTLNGKTFKGPFTFKTSTITVKIDDTTYVETSAKGKLVYNLKREGKTYRLTREEEGEKVVILIDSIRKSDGRILFTTTRRNEARKERTVVNWICEPIVPQATQSQS